MNPELKRAIEEVIESVESASGWASRESRLNMMEVFCAVYQLKRIFAQELQAPKTKRKITKKWISPSEKF